MENGSTPEPVAADKVNLWSDEPSPEDLLAFDALALTLVGPLLDDALAPLALGVSGSWGSGKSTLLNLIATHLANESSAHAKVLVVPTQPWRYDPGVGAKESLIGEVLGALQAELEEMSGPKEKAASLLKRLSDRVDWAKAIKVAAKAGIAMQIPSVDQILELIKFGSTESSESVTRGLEEFRSEFADLMSSDELVHVKSVVVLVDDLDRCLPRTVVESLEAIRLFLAVPKMSFVIAADEDRVADALRVEFPPPREQNDRARDSDHEDPAELYLHKIVQTTLPIPALNRFDTQAYIVLLQVQGGPKREHLSRLIGVCNELRKLGKSLDDLEPDDAKLLAEELQFAARLTPVLYDKLRGNPRRIKRFLNDLALRRTVARRRGIDLDAAVVAKLMILEVLFKDDFEQVLEWLGRGELRTQITELERVAGRPEAKAGSSSDAPVADSSVEPSALEKKPAKKSIGGEAQPVKSETQYGESLLRWAKLPPALSGLDLVPYLHLAASFQASLILDQGLPERLRDIAANLLGSTRREREAVGLADLQALQPRDVEELVGYVGRVLRDQPAQQKIAVTALLRIARESAAGAPHAAKALESMPIGDVSFATPMLFRSDDYPEILAVLARWRERSSDPQVKAAIDEVVRTEG